MRTPCCGNLQGHEQDRRLGAPVRGGARGLPCAVVRAHSAAAGRSAAAGGTAGADLRLFPGPAPAGAKGLSGRHRRHRRSEPQSDRAVAVAAHHRGRSRQPHHPARRARHRFRRHLRRARPHVAGDRRAKLSRHRRRYPRQARQPAEQRCRVGRCDQAVACCRRRSRHGGRHRRGPRGKPRCKPALQSSGPIRPRIL